MLNAIMLFDNDLIEICNYKSSLNGLAQDFIINLKEISNDLTYICTESREIIEKLFKYLNFEDNIIRARLVADIEYVHVNNTNEVIEYRNYHFPSLKSEIVNDVNEWLVRHMLKICERIETFNNRGSNLLINKINHIHICITKCG